MKILFSIIILFFNAVLFSQHIVEKYFKEGNKEYLRKFYDEASVNYIRALQDGGDNYKVNFNLGNSMYRLNKYNDAVYQYKRALELVKNKREQIDVYFNLGNAYYKNKEFEKSVDYFKKALKLNPNDEQIRYNYALAKDKLKKNGNELPKEKNKEDKIHQSIKPEEDKGKSLNLNQPDNSKENDFGKSGGNSKNNNGTGVGEDKNRDIVKEAEVRKDYKKLFDDIGEMEKKAQQRIINKKIKFKPEKTDKDW